VHLPLNSVDESIMFLGCPSAAFVRPSVHLSGQILLPRYIMKGLSNLDETYVEYSIAPTDDLIKFWRSKSQQAVKVESCEHHISWITWAVLIKLTGNNH